MSKTRTPSPHAGPTDLPSWSWTWNASPEDLEAMFATDDDGVDTALIPNLAYRDAVEEAATPGKAPVTSTRRAAEATVAPTQDAETAVVPALEAAGPEAKAAPETSVEPEVVAEPETSVKPEVATAPETEAAPGMGVERVAAPVGHSLRSRHATPESKAAVRRNLIAVCCVAVSVVVVGIATGLVGGWIALAAYTLLVLVAAVVLRHINARYAPRHSRYSARHA